MQKSQSIAVSALPILGQAAAPIKPTYSSFDHPPPRQHGKSLYSVRAFYDLEFHFPQYAPQGLTKLRPPIPLSA